jgi:hypothetical protein
MSPTRTSFVLLLCPSLLWGTPNPEKVLRLHKATAPIVLDGIIEPEWSLADSTELTFQLQPYFKKPPTDRTVAKVLAANEALYCLMVCYEPSSEIQQNTGLLDQADGDIVSIMLDTFNDHRTAYKLAVNAAGVRADCRLLDDARNRDYRWDGIWFADSRVYDWGFVVEMEIPYRSIQYDPASPTWGLDFDRWIPAKTEDLYWSEYEQNEGQRISKFGRLDMNGLRPNVTGEGLEVYPVAISRSTYGDSRFLNPAAGIDIFYNPSEQLTFQLTGNPDFAQIEADPYQFNISRYESYFEERRPFFTEGNEIFMPSGKDNNTGFYSPMELFYSRRIGKALSDGTVVPLNVGAKAFGRAGEWEYGGFVARTGGKDYLDGSTTTNEAEATFVSARLKRRIFDNSSIGALFVAKYSKDQTDGVIDVDGALRGPSWQLSYQVARSIENSNGDYGAAAGFVHFGDSWVTLARARAIGNDFNIDQVGFVPWRGTFQLAAITGPIWRYDTGYLRQMLMYAGGQAYYEHADLATDRVGVLGFNMQFRNNWGYEITLIMGKSLDAGVEYTSSEVDLSSWFNTSPKWHGSLYAVYAKTYNFSRGFLAPFWRFECELEWKAMKTLELGTTYGMFIENTPSNSILEITYNARPYFSVTPFNNLNLRVYVDNLWLRSTGRLERLIGGMLVSYNFLPKSWIYLAINEVRERLEETDAAGNRMPPIMRVRDRVGVLKIKYLYYI